MITEKDIGRKVIVNAYAEGHNFINMPGIIASAEYKNNVNVKLDDGYIYSITIHCLTFVDDENKVAKIITEKDIGRNVVVTGNMPDVSLINEPGVITGAEYAGGVKVRLFKTGYVYTIPTDFVKFVCEENKNESTRQVKEGYEKLDAVLYDAISQSQDGKGKERHATNNNYEDQVICVVGRLLKGHPFGAHAYQIIKKTIEAGRLYQRKGQEAAYQEMLGSINYAAAMCILIKEGEK